METPRHFIWDFDGTLFDTYPVIIENLRLALGEFGFTCDSVEAMGLMLTNIPTARNHYADRFGFDRKELESAYLRHHRTATEQLRAQPMEGAREVLERIRDTGRHSYIFTHRHSGETLAYLRKYGLDEFFRDIVAPDTEGFAPKPAPDAVLYLMEKYGMSPDSAVMIGDRNCDLGSGRNAGIRCAHLICPAVPETLECDWKLENLREMLEKVK